MQDDVQPSYIVGSHADYTSDSNMTPYDQYVKDNAMPVVQNNASTVPNDMYVMIDNDLHEPKAQSVFKAPTYTVADNSLNAELAIYKEQVELYERRARFELTEREQKIDEQLRIVICDRNIKEENLKKELHSVKLQLASTIQHNKLMMKAEALKEQNTRPIKALTVYPLNTPATLGPIFLRAFKSSNKEAKEMRDAFDELGSCELDKVLLIEVFYVASNSELNVSRFTEMQKAHNVVKARCLELEAELSNLRNNIRKDNYNELLNWFSNLKLDSGNDNWFAVMGYGDYVVGDSVISRNDESPPNLLAIQSLLAQIRWLYGIRCLKPLELRKEQKAYHKPKLKYNNWKVLNTLHMDLCGSMRVQTINGKKYILNLSPKDSAKDSTAEQRCRKTEPNSCRGSSDNANLFKGTDVSLG
ncbi:hypothetical protein Tco_0371546 [Tanacetum coccineum]